MPSIPLCPNPNCRYPLADTNDIETTQTMPVRGQIAVIVACAHCHVAISFVIPEPK